LDSLLFPAAQLFWPNKRGAITPAGSGFFTGAPCLQQPNTASNSVQHKRAEFMAFFPLGCGAGDLSAFVGVHSFGILCPLSPARAGAGWGAKNPKNRKRAPLFDLPGSLAAQGQAKNRTHLVFHMRLW
jgi:hypothetical protein